MPSIHPPRTCASRPGLCFIEFPVGSVLQAPINQASKVSTPARTPPFGGASDPAADDKGGRSGPVEMPGWRGHAPVVSGVTATPWVGVRRH